MTEILLGIGVIVALVVGLAVALVGLRQRLVPDIGLDVAVNERLHLVARRGDKLLEVLHGAGILIPAACGGSGTCGLCRVKVTGDGAGGPQATERGVLSARDRRANVRLACQTSLRGDCAVSVPDDILSAGGGFDCTVASVRMLAPLIREIVVDLPDDRSSEFRAGDFMQITAPPYRLDFSTIMSVARPPSAQTPSRGTLWFQVLWNTLSPSSQASSSASTRKCSRSACTV